MTLCSFLYINIKFLMEELNVMSFHISCDSHHCCDCWLSVYYSGTKQILILQLVDNLTINQIINMLYFCKLRLPYLTTVFYTVHFWQPVFYRKLNTIFFTVLIFNIFT